MSLIIDALKKAQELRLKESKGTPFPTNSADRKDSLRSLRKRWIFIGMGLTSLVIFFLIFWNFASPPSTSIPIQAAVHIEKKPSFPIEEKKPQAPSKEIVSLTEDVLSLPKDNISLAKVTSGVLKNTSSPTPTLPSPLKVEGLGGKEKIPAKMIEVKREGDNDRLLASELIHHFNSGIQFNNQREFLKAVQAYQKVIELDPNYIEAYNNLGIIYQEMGDFDKAFEAFQKSIEINPQYEKGHNNLGILYYLKGRNEEALEAFQKALAINPNNIESHINLGVLFKKQGQLKKAIESYQKALDINPLLGEVHYNIALLYEQLDHIEWAIGHYQQFIKLSSASRSDLVLRVQRHMDELMKEIKKKK